MKQMIIIRSNFSIVIPLIPISIIRYPYINKRIILDSYHKAKLDRFPCMDTQNKEDE